MKKILIVDDNSTNLYMLEALLKGYGFSVTSAENGKDALDKARLDPPDLVVTDILMPLMDGYTLCREWKSDDALKHIPLVFYTATYTESKDEEFALSLGADRFVLKPQEPDALIAILQKVLKENYEAKQVAVRPLGEEMEFFRQYNEVLFRKLEKKMNDLETVNEELRELEEHYRVIFENVTDAIYTIDSNLTITGVSPGVERLLGYKPEDFIGKPVSDLGVVLTPESLEQAVDDISVVLSGETISSTIYEFIAKDGERKFGEVSGSPIVRDGRITGIISVARDITDRKRAEEDLKESEGRLRDILFTMADWVWEVDENGVYSYSSQKGREILGRSDEDIIGKAPFDFMPPDEAKRVAAIFSEIAANKKSIKDLDNINIGMDGERIYLRTNAVPILDEEGNLKGYRGVDKDVTELKRAEEVLAESEKQYRLLAEKMTDMVWITDMNLKTVYVSPSVESMLGFTPEERMAQDINEQLTPESMSVAIDCMGKELALEQQGQADPQRKISLELEYYHKDGSTRWLESIMSGLRDDRGVLTGLHGVSRDVTDRRRAEEKIKEYSENLERMVEERTEELNRALFDSQEARDRIDGILKSVADGLIVTDLHNHVILMNRSAEDLLGVRFSSVINRSIDYAIRDDTLRERIRTTLEKREPGYQFDFELPGKDSDHPRIMRARTSVIKDKNGRHTGIITIIQDVTHEREVDRMKTEFLSTAAHELRSPLTSILGFSELLMSRDDITDDERKRFLSHINRQSKNLAAIISDLLDISRIESGRGFTMNRVPTDVGKLARDVASRFEAVSSAHRFDLDFPGEPVELLIDPDKMEQAFTNIFSNAVKYSPGGGVIKIVGEISGDHYQVSVEDKGIGMTPEQAEKIFDKFYRVDSSNTAVPGTGLGMSIVKHIVEAHGGTVWVESEFGKGTTVRFTIPLKSNNG